MVICRPTMWIRGIVPLSLAIALALYGARDEVERDLSERASAALRDAGYYWALVTFDARNAKLEGISFSGTERDKSLDLLKDIWGVREVTDSIQVIASAETYTWFATKKERRIQLRGYVPTEEDRRTITGFIKATLPDYEVDDKMALAGGSPPRQTWLGSVSFALVQLAQLREGIVRLNGTEFALDGSAETTAAYRKLNEIFQHPLPTGMVLKKAEIEPPLVKPYDWRVKYTGSTISFSGFIPDANTHQQIIERTRNLFPDATIEDTMELGSGAPDNWSWAISASLTQLNRLNSGRARLKESVLEFEGVAADNLTARQVTSSIRNSLPGSFRSSEKISVAGQAEQGKSESKQ